VIKAPAKKNTDFKSVELQIQISKSLNSLKDFYKDFILNYKVLNEKFHFTESFDESFLFEQIEKKYLQRYRELSLMPFGIKDVFNTDVLPTTMGSEIWEGFKAGNNARIVDELVDKGAVIFSKTTTAEFAVHYIQDGKTINPHNAEHITGTSSAGSAVAVACGALPIALGTQTAGSIIRPASFCGTFGFKPSFGAIDRTGVLKTADTLDTIGFLGSDLYGIRKTFLSTFQKEVKNYFYAANYFSNYESFKRKKSFKVGTITNQFYGYKDYDSDVKVSFSSLLSILSGESINFFDVQNVQFMNEIHELHDIIYCKSLAYYFQEERAHGAGMSDIMREMIDLGSKITTEDYLNAITSQPDYRKKFDDVMANYDFIITPSTASVAPKLGSKERPDTCLIWTYLGYPVLSLPIFWSEKMGLPFGLQIVARKFDDLAIFDFAEKLMDMLHEAA
jgi:Asp-tRNA(Asn)/Glu-tRNA(Gln) amidotransferase A subunit family amidase